MKILIEIIIKDKEGEIIAKKEALDWESAQENLQKLQSYVERLEAMED